MRSYRGKRYMDYVCEEIVNVSMSSTLNSRRFAVNGVARVWCRMYKITQRASMWSTFTLYEANGDAVQA